MSHALSVFPDIAQTDTREKTLNTKGQKGNIPGRYEALVSLFAFICLPRLFARHDTPDRTSKGMKLSTEPQNAVIHKKTAIPDKRNGGSAY